VLCYGFCGGCYGGQCRFEGYLFSGRAGSWSASSVFYLAPKSGEDTRRLFGEEADEGKDFAQKKARELRERADELIERSKEVAGRKKDSISAAVEAGREAYLRESKS